MRQLTIRSFALLMAACLITMAQSRAQNGAAPPNLSGFDGFGEQVMKDWKVPGIAVAVVKDGQAAGEGVLSGLSRRDRKGIR